MLIHVRILVSYGHCSQALWPWKGCTEPSRARLHVTVLCAGHRWHPCPQSPPQCNVPKGRELLTRWALEIHRKPRVLAVAPPREQFSPLLKLRSPRGRSVFKSQKGLPISVLHDLLLLADFLSHVSFHSSLLLWAKAFSCTISACLRLLISKGMFRKKILLIPAQPEKKPMLPALGLELIPSFFALHFCPSWLNQAIILKGNFKLFVTPTLPPPPPHPPPHPTTHTHKSPI